MPDLQGTFDEREHALKWEQPMAHCQAVIAAKSPRDPYPFEAATAATLRRYGILDEGGRMSQETKTALAGPTVRERKQLAPKEQVRELLTRNRTAIMAAMPKHLNGDRLLRVAQTACSTTPGLLDCYVPSLLGGIMAAAQLGLEPNTPLGHAYLIPYRNANARRTDAQLVIGYKGLIDLALRSGRVVSIVAHVVRDGDVFHYQYGLQERLDHVPADGERGAVTHAYAYANLREGGRPFEVMPVADIVKIMKATQGGGKHGPWKDHFEEMARKTVVRRLAKYLPLSVEAADAASADARTVELDDAGVLDVVADEGALPDPEAMPQTAAQQAAT